MGRIVDVAAARGLSFQIVALLLLALLPASLAVVAYRIPAGSGPASARGPGSSAARATCGALAAYVAAIVLVPVLGSFPVPVLGFGVSPVLGVAICAGLSAALADPRGRAARQVDAVESAARRG